jgi:hypothetical protein
VTPTAISGVTEANSTIGYTCYAAYYYYYYQLGTSLGTKDPALGFNVFFSPPVLLGALPNFLLLFIFPNEGAL